jgi:hypothetical protein
MTKKQKLKAIESTEKQLYKERFHANKERENEINILMDGLRKQTKQLNKI